MPPKPLKTLKAGLASFKQQIKHWLDNDANLVDEEKVLELLETASPDEPRKVVPMALHELLNPVNENGMHDASGSQMEIFQAVMEHVESEQTREMNGSDVEDLNALSTDAELKPARREALKAALTLQAYVADLNEPFARELEDILAKFGRQTRLDEFKSLRPTAITDYLPWLASNE
ncbi:hypothetical protein C0995_007048 [Termitomyces sp. Mi166|nr:hypothetical protein C0995_007048 [Termitomyces sp. Mi166\